MGRKSNSKKQRREGSSTSISQHKRQGKKLIPPFQQIDNLKKVSWSNDRLPEYIWIALIVSLHEREESIQIIKRISKFFYDLKEEYRPIDLSITSLGNLEEKTLDTFLDFICNHLGIKETLKPLALFDNLPGRDKWREYLTINVVEEEWEKLYVTIAKCFDHQSQEATDCRWSKLFYFLVTDKLRLPRDMAEQIFEYPYVGDMRTVRPTIRSTEMTLGMLPDGTTLESKWCDYFWEQGLKDTPCWSLDLGVKLNKDVKVDKTNFEIVKGSLKAHFSKTNISTGVDAKHDAVFGISMYCLEILEELIKDQNNTSILSRIGLRTIAECYITLAYLCHQNDGELWKTYRSYGSGQAKLSFLKLDEMESKPKYIDTDTLKALAGEDQWEEFVEINLGHWENTNLRKMSETASVKEEYNSYYDWTSGFAHGQWAAVRNTVFDTCGNPMHRLHRIPKQEKQEFNDVTEDAKKLCNKVLDLVDKTYPDFTIRLK
jgi:hypothetical protein